MSHVFGDEAGLAGVPIEEALRAEDVLELERVDAIDEDECLTEEQRAGLVCDHHNHGSDGSNRNSAHQAISARRGNMVVWPGSSGSQSQWRASCSTAVDACC